MMSTENLLGEFKEAAHSTPRSLNSSIQVELERHVSKNLRSGLVISDGRRHLAACLGQARKTQQSRTLGVANVSAP